MKTLITTTALVLSMTATAAAAGPLPSYQLAGGPIFAGNVVDLDCFYINFGGASITPTVQQIFQYNSTTPMNSNSSCPNGIAVAPNQSCTVYTTDAVQSYVPYACKLTFSAPAKNVRGKLQLFDSSINIVSEADLR